MNRDAFELVALGLLAVSVGALTGKPLVIVSGMALAATGVVLALIGEQEHD